MFTRRLKEVKRRPLYKVRMANYHVITTGEAFDPQLLFNKSIIIKFVSMDYGTCIPHLRPPHIAKVLLIFINFLTI